MDRFAAKYGKKTTDVLANKRRAANFASKYGHKTSDLVAGARKAASGVKSGVRSSAKSNSALNRAAKVAAAGAASYATGRLGMTGIVKAQKAVWAKQGYNPTASKSNKSTSSTKTTGASRREIKKAAKAQYKSDMAKIRANGKKFSDTYNSKAAADRKWSRSAEADKMLGDYLTKSQSDIKAAKARYKEAKRRR